MNDNDCKQTKPIHRLKSIYSDVYIPDNRNVYG